MPAKDRETVTIQLNPATDAALIEWVENIDNTPNLTRNRAVKMVLYHGLGLELPTDEHTEILNDLREQLRADIAEMNAQHEHERAMLQREIEALRMQHEHERAELQAENRRRADETRYLNELVTELLERQPAGNAPAQLEQLAALVANMHGNANGATVPGAVQTQPAVAVPLEREPDAPPVLRPDEHGGMTDAERDNVMRGLMNDMESW